jgi:hypothetical protein
MDKTSSYGGYEPISFMDYYTEKLAELIVQECVGVNYKSPFRDGEFHAREVLEHFGVEE